MTSPAGPFGAPAWSDSPPPPVKSGRSVAGTILVILLFAGPIAGLAIGAWAFLRARDSANTADEIVEDAQQTVDSLLQDAQEQIDAIEVPAVPAVSLPTVTVPTITAPGVAVGEQPPASAPTAVPTFVSPFAEGGAPALIAQYDAAISGEPTRFLQVILYPEYAFAQAQDADIPDHVDEYPWRDGAIGPSSPVQLVGDGDLDANLWSATEVDWTFLARAVAEAPGLTTVEQGTVSHIIVERSVFTADFAVVVRVYVTGPRSSGYVEYTAAGALIQVVQ
jgi:hypothetical protein